MALDYGFQSHIKIIKSKIKEGRTVVWLHKEAF